MIFENSLAAVDPAVLAVNSGVTKVPAFSLVVPQVIRPHLLTDQLRAYQLAGCECGGMHGSRMHRRPIGTPTPGQFGLPPDYGVLRGLGDTYPGDPGTFDMNALQVPSAGSGNTSVLQTMALGANFIPGVGQIASAALTTFRQYMNQFESWFHIGAGRREADIIVPTQNNLMQALGGITNQILTGQAPDLSTLESLYRQVWMMGVAFMEFVLQRQFTDRRASGQALNTVMQYIDGSCGYPEPVGFTASPSRFNCLSWGDGTIGGVGTNGMLGAIGRAITNQGGTIQDLPNLETAANQGIKLSSIPMPGGIPATIMGIPTGTAALLASVALFLYKRGAFGRG